MTANLVSCSKPIFVRPKEVSLRSQMSRGVGYFVRCGKCCDCLNLRQNDLACRIAREAYKRGSLIFVTFTYKPDTIPFAVNLCRVDTDTGEVTRDYNFNILETSELLDSLRSDYAKMIHSASPVRIERTSPFFLEGVDYQYYYEFTPTLNREDFRLWLKRERVNFERKHGFKLPEFSYCCVGEYGSHTCRPHYHCCFMGLTVSQVNEIVQSWRDDFGFVHVKAVQAVNKDGTPGFVKAGKYVGKYLVKGCFDCETTLDGIAQKGRICCSKFLGTDLSQDELFYYSAYDLYGIYDPERMCFLDGRKISKMQFVLIASETYKRSKIVVGGQEFFLPSAIKNRIWKRPYKIESSKSGKYVVYRYQTVILRKKIADIVASSLFANSFKPYLQVASGKPLSEGYAAIRALIASKESDIAHKEEVRKFDFVKRYNSSIF